MIKWNQFVDQSVISIDATYSKFLHLIIKILELKQITLLKFMHNNAFFAAEMGFTLFQKITGQIVCMRYPYEIRPVTNSSIQPWLYFPQMTWPVWAQRLQLRAAWNQQPCTADLQLKGISPFGHSILHPAWLASLISDTTLFRCLLWVVTTIQCHQCGSNFLFWLSCYRGQIFWFFLFRSEPTCWRFWINAFFSILSTQKNISFLYPPPSHRTPFVRKMSLSVIKWCPTAAFVWFILIFTKFGTSA